MAVYPHEFGIVLNIRAAPAVFIGLMLLNVRRHKDVSLWKLVGTIGGFELPQSALVSGSGTEPIAKIAVRVYLGLFQGLSPDLN